MDTNFWLAPTVGAAKQLIAAGSLPFLKSTFHPLPNKSQVIPTLGLLLLEKMGVAEKVINELGWDLAEAFQRRAPLSRTQCCQLVPPDVTFIVAEREFKAHSSLLGYYRYFAAQLTHQTQDALTKRIPVAEVEQEHFERLLDWLYTRSFAWAEVKANNQAVLENASLLNHMLELADRFQLAPLKLDCEKRLKRLYTFGAKLNGKALLARDFAFFRNKIVPHSFAKPFAEKLFHDVWFKAGKISICANRVLLTSRSLFFQRILGQQKGTQDAPILLDDRFPYKEWIEKIEKGVAGSPLLVPLESISEVTLKMAMEEKYRPLAKLDVTILPETKIDVEELKKKLAGMSLRHLHLSGCSWVDDAFVSWVAVHCPHLQTLNLCNTSLTDKSLVLFAKNCPFLKHLSLAGNKITENSVFALAEHCPLLTTLNLNFCSRVSNDSLLELAAGCPLLEDLELSGCNQVKDDAIVAMATRGHLKKLDISFCRWVTDKAIAAIAQHCEEFSKLDYQGCSLPTAKKLLKM